MASKVCRSINIHYFYNLLFTTVNLKLVHIVCHDKAQHDTAKCDPKFYLEDAQVELCPIYLWLLWRSFIIKLKIHRISNLIKKLVFYTTTVSNLCSKTFH